MNAYQRFVAEDDEIQEILDQLVNYTSDSTTHTASGIMFLDPTGRVLFIRRSASNDHAGEWCFPGGAIEPGETAEIAARREAQEEVGYTTNLPLEQVDRRLLSGVDFTTFLAEVQDPFDPVLDAEHTAAVWRRLDDAPEPLHPGVRATIDAAVIGDAKWNEEDHPRDKDGKWTAGDPKDVEHVMNYQADDPYTNAVAMNTSLREGDKLDKQQTKMRDAVDRAIAAAPPTTKDVKLYRGTEEDWHKGGLEKAFFSATSKRSVAEDIADGSGEKGTLYEITVPKGTKMLDIGAYAKANKEHFKADDVTDDITSFEKQYVLPRNAQFKRGKTITKGGRTIVQLTYQPKTKTKDEFNENLHPRDKDGKFAEKADDVDEKTGDKLIEVLKNHPMGKGASNIVKFGNTIEVQNFGHWVNPPDSEDEEDFDWQDPTPETEKAALEIANKFAEKHGVDVSVSGGEKNYLTFAIKPKEITTTAAPSLTKSNSDVMDFKSLKKIGEQKGSNAGGVYQDASGQKFYIKSMDEPHAKNERLAASLYALTGAKTLDYVDVKPDGDTHYVATKFEPLDKDNVSSLLPEERKQAQGDFATHAWLANWDAAGTGGDNQGVKDGVVKTLDVGGALEYRAKGTPKGAAFGTSVDEFNTLRDPQKNKDAASLFGGMTNSQIKQSAEKVTSLSDQDIKNAVLKGGGTEALANKLIARRNHLNLRVAALGNPALEKAFSTIAAAPTPTAAPSGDKTPHDYVKQVSGNSAERIEWRKQLKTATDPAAKKELQNKIIASFKKHYDKTSSAEKKAEIASKIAKYSKMYKVPNPLTTAATTTAAVAFGNKTTSTPTPKPATASPPVKPSVDLSNMSDEEIRVHMLGKVTGNGVSWVKAGQVALDDHLSLKDAGITASEIGYIKAFTGPSSSLNKQLRDGHMSEEVFYFKHIMNDALDKFPEYKGDTVWRKISIDDATRAKYNKTGSIVHWPAFSSTAKNPKVWSGNTQFVIHNPKTGRDVQKISQHMTEAEVIMPADTYYKVLKPPEYRKCEDGVTRHVIELEEVVPFGKKKKAV